MPPSFDGGSIAAPATSLEHIKPPFRGLSLAEVAFTPVWKLFESISIVGERGCLIKPYEPGTAKGVRTEGKEAEMTYAEASIRGGRDDDHMTYEEYNISQYTDGSVLNCLTMTTYTAQDVIDGAVSLAGLPPFGDKYKKALAADLRRNAKKANRKVA